MWISTWPNCVSAQPTSPNESTDHLHSQHHYLRQGNGSVPAFPLGCHSPVEEENYYLGRLFGWSTVEGPWLVESQRVLVDLDETNGVTSNAGGKAQDLARQSVETCIDTVGRQD